MGRPLILLSPDPDRALPFGIFGVTGGSPYLPWTGTLSFLRVFLWWFLTDEITLTIKIFLDDPIDGPFEQIHNITLKRQAMPETGTDREYWLAFPGHDRECLNPPDGTEETGPFRWVGLLRIGDAEDQPLDPIWGGLRMEVELDLCGIMSMSGAPVSVDPYPFPVDRYGASDGLCAPTFRVHVKIKYDKGSEGEFHIQSFDPIDYFGATIPGGSGAAPPRYGVSDFDGEEFEIVELGAPETIFIAPAELTFNTSKWFPYSFLDGTEPRINSMTGDELIPAPFEVDSDRGLTLT